jgi:hypothetical protein
MILFLLLLVDCGQKSSVIAQRRAAQRLSASLGDEVLLAKVEMNSGFRAPSRQRENQTGAPRDWRVSR